MKSSTVLLLSLSVALAMGQNYYLQFSGAPKEAPLYPPSANDVAPYYVADEVRPKQAYPLASPGRGYGYGYGYDGYGVAGYEPAPRIFFSNIFTALGITAVTNYRYTATTTTTSSSVVTVNCVSLAAAAPSPAPACNAAADGGAGGGRFRRGVVDVISPSPIDSVEPTAVSSLADGADRRGRHLPQLTSSRDEDVDVDVVGVKRPQKRQLIPRPFQTTIITASVVTSFVVTTTTVPLAGSDYTCTPPGFATCA